MPYFAIVLPTSSNQLQITTGSSHLALVIVFPLELCLELCAAINDVRGLHMARRVLQEVDLPYLLQQAAGEEILWHLGRGYIEQMLITLSRSISANWLECRVVTAYRAYGD